MLHLGGPETCRNGDNGEHRLSLYNFEDNPALQERIDECMQKCSANLECKFFFVSSMQCQQYSLCDGFRTPEYQGYTFEKQIKGKINF